MTAHGRDLGYLVNPPLHRHLDVDAAVDDVREAIRAEPVVVMAIDGKCAVMGEIAVSITFPDADLLKHVKPRVVDEVRRGMGKRVLGAWTTASQSFLLDGVTTTGLDEPATAHLPEFTDTCAERDSDGSVTKQGSIALPLSDDRSIDVLCDAVSGFLSQPAFQLASCIGMEVSLHGVLGSVSFNGMVHQAIVPVVPVRYWLQQANAEHARAWFHAPGVAGAVAWWCAGYLVTADQAQLDKEVMKRRNVAGSPMCITTALDVLGLVDEMDFLAFYPSVQRVDGSIGRIVIDLDVQQGLRSVVGDDVAWRLACDVSDAITATFVEAGFPIPTRLFSGSRGIHVIWTLAPGAVELGDDGRVTNEWYRAAVLAGDPRAGQLRANEFLLSDPGSVVKLVARAGCARAIHAHPGMVRREITAALFDAMRAAGASQPVTLTKEGDPASRLKVVLDVQPTVHRVLSPHHKSGLVARSITTRVGDIDPRFRDLEHVIVASRIDAATTDFPDRPHDYHRPPGVVSPDAFVAASKTWAPEIAMLLGLGLATTCDMLADSSQAWADHYRQLVDVVQGGGDW